MRELRIVNRKAKTRKPKRTNSLHLFVAILKIYFSVGIECLRSNWEINKLR